MVDSAEVGIDPLSVSLQFEAFPTARKEFRNLLQGLLPTIYDLTNNEILAKARAWLAQQKHRCGRVRFFTRRLAGTDWPLTCRKLSS